MSKISWLHISDIHIKSSDKYLDKYNREQVLAALWKDIKRRIDFGGEDLSSLDFAFITGDIAFSGDDGISSEYDEAYKTLISELVNSTGVNIDRIFVVPGNHDIARSSRTKEVLAIEERMKDYERLKELFVDPAFDIDRDKIFQRLMNYEKYVALHFPHIALDNKTCTYSMPIKLAHIGQPLRIIGLNSAWLSQGGETDKQNLFLAEPVVNKEMKDCSDKEIVITLVHHPIRWPSEWYKDKEKNVLNHVLNKTNFLLCGHVHESDVSSQLSLNGSYIAITAGSIFENREWHSNSYNYVSFDTEKRVGKIYLRRYYETPRGPEFLPDIISTGELRNGVFPIRLVNDKEEGCPNDANNFDKFLNAQQKELNRKPLLSGLYPDREIMGTLFPDVYVDPYVKPRRDIGASPVLLSEWLQAKYDADKKVLILGSAGSGKTTALLSINYFYSRKYDRQLSTYVPIYSEARSYPWETALTELEILDNVKRRIDLPTIQEEILLLHKQKTIYLIDAIDEAFPSVSQEYKAIDMGKLTLNFPHVASCRIDFFERNLATDEFCSQYDEILEIEHWQMSREVDQFLRQYFSKKQPGVSHDVEIEEVKKYIKPLVKNDNAKLIPLSVTVILFLWMYERDEMAKNPVASFGDLLDRFVFYWAKKEIIKGGSQFETPQMLLQAYEIAAWVVYLHRKAGSVPFEKIIMEIIKELPINSNNNLNDPGLLSLLLTKRDRTNSEKLLVISFSHEAIYEYLLARRLVESLRTSLTNNAILSKLMGHSINKLARELLNALSPDEKANLIVVLKRKYHTALKKTRIVMFIEAIFKRKIKNKLAGKYLNQNIIYRHNMAYFWGRLSAEIDDKSIQELFSAMSVGNIKEHEMIYTTVGSSILFLNDDQLEKKYLESIANNSTNDICNRVYHLVYYGDASYNEPDTFLKDYFETGKDDWPKTRQAILSRMQSSEARNQKMRGLDIVTFRRLYESRGVPNVSEMQKLIIKNCAKSLDLPDRKIELIRAELDRLVKLL